MALRTKLQNPFCVTDEYWWMRLKTTKHILYGEKSYQSAMMQKEISVKEKHPSQPFGMTSGHLRYAFDKASIRLRDAKGLNSFPFSLGFFRHPNTQD